jgi:surface antigen
VFRRNWKKITIGVALIGAAAAIFLVWNERQAGVVIDTYKDVAIYDNGPLVSKSHGRNYSATGYYYGQKWQCVEFVKRFFDQAKHHQMPDVWGHAKDFFDTDIPQGALNTHRGLTQYRNGGNESPAVDDLLVFSGAYGHVAIVTEVGSNYVQVAQQNIYKRPRQRFELIATNGTFTIRPAAAMGWLRLK